MDQIDAGVEPAEQPVRGVEERERFLVAAHRLARERELTCRLGLTQDRTGLHRQLHRRPQTRLGQRGTAGLAIDHPDDAIGFDLECPHAPLVEHGERRLGIPQGFIVALPGHMDLRAVHEAEPLEPHISTRLRDREAVREISLSVIPQAPIPARHSQIVIGNRAAVLVARGAIRLERAGVVRTRLDEIAVDVRQDAEVLLGAGAQLAAVPTQNQSVAEGRTGLDQLPALEGEPSQRIQRLRSEDVVFHGGRHFVATLAQTTRGFGLVAVVSHHGEAPQRLAKDRRLVVSRVPQEIRGPESSARVSLRTPHHATAKAEK